MVNANSSTSPGLNLNAQGFLHIEIDQGQIQREYRPQHGDRAAIFGRWVVDAGHDTFSTEIHPLLLAATARHTALTPDIINVVPRPLSLMDGTHSTVISRAHLVGQYFIYVRWPGGGNILGGLRASLTTQLYEYGVGSRPLWERINLNPNMFPGWRGGSCIMTYVVSPPTSRKAAGGQLFVRYHFTVRTGVSAYVLNTEMDSVEIRVTFVDDGTPLLPIVPPGGQQITILPSELDGEVALPPGETVTKLITDQIDAMTQNNPLMLR